MVFERNIQNEDVLMPEVIPVQIEKKYNGEKKCCL